MKYKIMLFAVAIFIPFIVAADEREYIHYGDKLVKSNYDYRCINGVLHSTSFWTATGTKTMLVSSDGKPEACKIVKMEREAWERCCSKGNW